ncbi:MAG: SpoIIE family protein phosphatase [Thermoanaerobaculia bacterium]|jgi:sigma-B regulation protein RsbU (phosphoserine phosphatase)
MKPLSECRILIVDDVTANVDVLVGALKGEHKLSVALDGDSALRFVEKTLPDLILLDIMMPGMDGYEVCRRLRANEATRDIPIMFLSALEDVANKAKGFEVGGNDYVTKPFEILEVKARVRSLLKAKAYADAIREAMEREMAIAREIQMGILPSDLSQCTTKTGLDIHAAIEPAKHVGGDLFEVMRLDDDRVVIVIGDVMGKGIPASIFMAVTMTLVRALARQHREPNELLRRLNDELAAQNPRRMFVTLAYLVIELSTGRVIGASAGHNPLLLVRASGETRAVFRSSGMVAGMMSGRTYTNESLELTRGDMLVLNTDGVPDAENPQEEQYGDDRLLALVTASAGRSAEQTVVALLEEVRAFSAGAAQTDDITILAVKYDPDARGVA